MIYSTSAIREMEMARGRAKQQRAIDRAIENQRSVARMNQATAYYGEKAKALYNEYIGDRLTSAKQFFDDKIEQGKEFVTNLFDSENPSNPIENFKDLFTTEGSSPSTYSKVKPSKNSGKTVKEKPIDYLNADLAKHYGMDARSAYSEALQNTAYQRAVADLKAAGLNPVLAAGSVAPAGAFAAGDTLSGGSGSGSSGARTSGMSGKYAMSKESYNLLGVVGSVVGGVIGFAASPKPWKLMGAATGADLGKDLLQSGAQGFDSIKKIFD